MATTRETALVSAAQKVKDALESATTKTDLMEVFSLGGGLLEELTDTELTVLMRALVNEQSRRQDLM